MNESEYISTVNSLKRQIWEKCKQSIPNVQAAAIKAKVTLPITTVTQAEAVLKALRAKKAKPKENVPDEIKQRYRNAKYTYESINYPMWIKDQYFIEPDFPNTATANGLTSFIEDLLKWEGHFVNRTGNEGRSIEKNGEIIRIPSSSKNGMQDIDTNLTHPDHKFGIPWKIEVKAGGDTHKQHQKDFGKQVTKTGAVYSVVRNAEDFILQYDKLMVREVKQSSIFE